MAEHERRWTKHCPVCDGLGTLDMVKIPYDLRYIFHCPTCKRIYDVGMVCGPVPGLEAKYRELVGLTS